MTSYSEIRNGDQEEDVAALFEAVDGSEETQSSEGNNDSDNGTDQFSPQEIEQMTEAVEGNGDKKGSNNSSPLSEEDIEILTKMEEPVTEASGSLLTETQKPSSRYLDGVVPYEKPRAIEQVPVLRPSPVIHKTPENLFVFSYDGKLTEEQVKQVFEYVHSLRRSFRNNKGLLVAKVEDFSGKECYGIYSKYGGKLEPVSKTFEIKDCGADLEAALENYREFRDSDKSTYRRRLENNIFAEGKIALNVIVQKDLEGLARQAMNSVLRDSRPLVFRFELMR